MTLRRWLTSLSLGAIATAINTIGAIAAETIFFVYGPLNFSLRISSLEAFAEDKTLNKNLGQYFELAGVGEEEKAKFREALTTPVKVDPSLVSRLLNTEEGERILNYFGKVINAKGGRNGKYILRGALIQAAMEPEGLNLLNVLRKFPLDVQIDLQKALTYSEQVEIIVKGSYFLHEQVSILSAMEATEATPVDFAQLRDLRQPGRMGIKKETWNLHDSSRERKFYVDVYKPQTWRSGKTPVVVISHGLNSKPAVFAKRAEHLASYGYVVVLPQHPGSDTQQTQDFLEGYTRTIFPIDEFLDRPQDISYTLDELERRNEQEFEGRLDLENVGIFGHSFGGYTALAVAGATPDFEALQRECSLDIGNLNPAFLLQCRALNLEPQAYNFRDERIKAVYAINPVNTGIFGPLGLSQISIPTFMAGGSHDPLTPFIFEQLLAYPWLTNADSYLQLQEGQAHIDFSELDAGITDMVEAFAQLTLPDPSLLDDYTNSMMLAFFEVYVSNNAEYRPYLQSSYAKYLSEGQEFKSYLITNASSEKLLEIIESLSLLQLKIAISIG